jgi:imidazolonepropionase-like amidohydrolase
MARVAVVAALLAPPSHAQAPAAGSAAGDIAIRGGWLFDGIGSARVRNTGVVIRGGKIMEVGAALAGRDLGGLRVIDLDNNTTILPGFFDLHSHYNMDIVGEGRVEEVAHNAMIQLANGVTSVWPGGEFVPQIALDAKRQIDSGRQPGARIFPSGPYFGAFRCEYKIKTAADECVEWPNSLTEAQIRADVDHWAGQGVRSLKIKQSTPEEMRIIIDQAHRRGLTTTSHLSNYAGGYDVDIKEAILMGLDRVEHGYWRRPSQSGTPSGSSNQREMIDLFVKHRVYYDPNMQMSGGDALREAPELRAKMAWVDESQFYTQYARTRIEQWEAEQPRTDLARRLEGFKTGRAPDLKAFYDGGGGDLLVLGTDLPAGRGCCGGAFVPGFAYHREMQAWVYAGLPPVAVLKAATINGARALRVADQLGSIEVGKIADLVIVAGDPLQDITAAREVRTVVKDGRVHDPKALLAASINKIGPAGPTADRDWSLYHRFTPFVVRTPSTGR